MKTYSIVLTVITLLFVSSCQKSDSDILLEVSNSSFHLNNADSTVQVTITSNTDWKVSSNSVWCSPDQSEGSNNGQLNLSVLANINTSPRVATITLSSGKTSRSIVINQAAGSADGEEYHYKLPVIFHLLYADKNNINQYVKQGRVTEILAMCNQLYKGAQNIESADFNMEFVPATQAPDGSTLLEPGVERILWDSPIMDCEKFMEGKEPQYVKLLWDPNKYINVIVYTFTNKSILGISHFPYSTEPSYLEGLSKINYSPQLSNLKYPHCVSINNQYIYVQSDNQRYYTADVIVTLAHELGHYLGLHHAFSQDNNGNTDLCKDTDYCKDTPTYNRAEYDSWLSSIRVADYSFKELIARKSCTNKTFLSYNIMDYSFCDSNQFTEDQRSRVRHVLTYSPLIPGPKRDQVKTRGLAGAQDLPFRYLK